jgi:Prion-inhibition and propagation
MNASCLELRTRLEMEQCRLLNFAEATGLLDHEENDPLPESLESEKLVLIAVLTQIGCKLDDFSALTNRYKPLRKGDETASEAKNVKEEFVSLKKKWEASVKKSPKRRERLRGTNHLFRWFGMGIDIAKEPERLWWAAFDEKVFKTILQQLVEYNNYLHELTRGQHAKKLEMTTRQTYLEMVLVRGEVDELRRLLVNSILLQDHRQVTATPRAAKANAENGRLLNGLVDTKSQSLINDEPDEKKPPAYEEATRDTKLSYEFVDLLPEPKKIDVMQQRVQTSGKYWPEGKSETEARPSVQVWVEWKEYKTEIDDETRNSVPLAESLKRVKELVALLQSSRLNAFRIPACLGWYDYRDNDIARSSHPPLYGIVFRKEDQSDNSSDPISLLDHIKTVPCPSLSARAALAHKLADSVLYLHAVRWLHKSIRSDGILFFLNAKTHELDIREPYMSGFEYSRPDRTDAHSTHIPPSPRNEAYVHPSYQGVKARGTYRKSFDIYSLGIVLLEIAYWQPILTILADEFATKAEPISSEVQLIQTLLIDTRTKYVENLKGMVGERFHTAVDSCLCVMAGRKDETTIEASAKLQRDFTHLVVENLASVIV